MQRGSWNQIRDQLDKAIASGELPAGAQLPTEGELSLRFGAGRHSVRRAVQAMAIEGKLRVEQGRGTFVASQPRLTYRIGRRTRFRQNLAAQGFAAAWELVGVEVLAAPAGIAACLGLDDGARVVRATRRGLADGAVISLGVAWSDHARLPQLEAMAREGLGLTDIYARHGIADYLRRSTVVSARAAEPAEAALLRLHPATPVLVVSKLDVLPEGTPLGWSESIWSSGLVQFGIELDENDAGEGPDAGRNAASSAPSAPGDHNDPGDLDTLRPSKTEDRA